MKTQSKVKSTIKSTVNTLALSAMLFAGSAQMNNANAMIASTIFGGTAPVGLTVLIGSTAGFFGGLGVVKGSSYIYQAFKTRGQERDQSILAGFFTILGGVLLLDENTKEPEFQILDTEASAIVMKHTSLTQKDISIYNQEVDTFNALMSAAHADGMLENGDIDEEIMRNSLKESSEGLISPSTFNIAKLLSKVALHGGK